MFEEVNSELVKVEFNASLVITELLAKSLEKYARELASRCIEECALRHNFDASEEIRALKLENLALIRKPMAKKSVKKRTILRSKEQKEKKVVFPMPFIASTLDLKKCNGLAYNHGLFTQCPKEQMENSKFCKRCQAECDSSATGIPKCGTVEQRLATGLYEFKDPKGRSPISYLKVLEKAKLSPEQSLDEAFKLSIEIDEEHFAPVSKEKKKVSAGRGRPKKAVLEADNVTDLFAKLTADGIQEEPTETDEPAKKTKKGALTDEEKAAKKAALEEERAVKKAEREAKLAAEKTEKEAKRKAEAEQKKAEREAKLAEEKEEREAKKASEKAAREAKKAAEKAAKEAEKASKVKKSDAKTAPTAAPTAAAAQPAKVSVTRIQISGKQYLKSSTNILYNPETKEEVGIWDPETKTIKELPNEESEEEEEEEEEEEYEE